MRTRLLVIFVFLGSSCMAQEETEKSRIRYYNTFEVGMLMSDDHDNLAVQFGTVHGITYRRFRLGLGAGFDAYNYWSVVPIVASVDYLLHAPEKNGFYVGFNMGRSIAWRTDWPENGLRDTYDEGGVVINPRIGYQLSGKKVSAYFAFGYQHQELKSGFEYWWGTSVQFEENYDRLEFVVGVGLR